MPKVKSKCASRCKVSRKTLAMAKKGDGDALLAVGCAAYTNGDYETAMKYYEAAAEKGVTQALVNLGYCHYYGRVTPVDYERAFQCFSKAAAEDEDVSPEAFFKLGDMYLWGNYVEKDPSAAFKLFVRAYEAACSWTSQFGDDADETDDVNFTGLLRADAAKRLGDCYRYGTGCEKNMFLAFRYYAEAERLFAKKASLGDQFAPSLYAKAREALDAVRDEIAP